MSIRSVTYLLVDVALIRSYSVFQLSEDRPDLERGLVMSQKSVHFKTAQLLYLEYARNMPSPGNPEIRTIDTELGSVSSYPHMAKPLLQLVLRGIAASNASTDGLSPIIQPVGRIEIFGDWYMEAAKNCLKDQGLVLFDVDDRPLLHVHQATIANEGSPGSLLTKAILDELEVDPRIFDEIQKSQPNMLNRLNPYYVVVQRIHRNDGSVDWEWWNVKSQSSWE